MGDKTKIEWSEATWNTAYGCTKVSPACAHCYIERTPPYRMRGLSFKYGEIPVQLFPERIGIPLRWKRPRRIFVNSLSDTFHEDVPNPFIAQMWATMAVAKQHTFQVLTKRPERMLDLLTSTTWRFRDAVETLWWEYHRGKGAMPWPLPNVWLGTTVENQRFADQRTPYLLSCPAAVYWLSVEPMCGPIDLKPRRDKRQCLICGIADDRETHNVPEQHVAKRHGIDWVVVGGESGVRARPMHPDWERQIREQCQSAGVAYFFKQWGEWAPELYETRRPGYPAFAQTGLPEYVFPDGTLMVRRGRKAAGRLVDGRTYDEYPEVQNVATP